MVSVERPPYPESYPESDPESWYGPTVPTDFFFLQNAQGGIGIHKSKLEQPILPAG